MFASSPHYHEALHNARQQELEAQAQSYRLAASVSPKKTWSPALRQGIGQQLISLGEKLAQPVEQNIQPALR